LYTTGNIHLLLKVLNDPPEPSGNGVGSSGEPEPAMKTSYVGEPSGITPQSTRVDEINKIFEAKFVGKSDKEMIDFLSGVYGQYKNVTELSIASWSEEKLNALVEALAKI